MGVGKEARKERANERQPKGEGTEGVDARAKNRQVWIILGDPPHFC